MIDRPVDAEPIEAANARVSGVLSFLFTDIEGSTRLWESRPDEMRAALARHDVLMRDAIERHSGNVFKTVGDAFCACFAKSIDAIGAAIDAQSALAGDRLAADIGLRTRIAIHVGSVEVRDGDYFGAPLNRVSRLLSAGHGGQILISAAARELANGDLPGGATLKDLGIHRLKDLQEPERIFEIVHPALPTGLPPLRTLDAVFGNLPTMGTSFVGRQRQLAGAIEHLKAAHILTLTGAGGTGKTRLSIQIGAETAADYPDGVWLVELAALRDQSLVPQQIASVLGVREVRGQPLAALLCEYLRARKLLLILDNCEHLIDACAQITAALSGACPDLRILVTSREALRVPGEICLALGSLDVPSLARLPAIGELARFEAIDLFVQRAESGASDFVLTEANAAAVARICVHLDGIPLALELAAARRRALSVQDIANRLDDRFRLLTQGRRTDLPRQQTLRATIDWSYDLLLEPERALFRRLSVFAGGFTLEAAETVCQCADYDAWEILDLLSQLVQKSLVLYDPGAGRYRLLESIGQYARDRLEEAGELQVRERHRDYYSALTARAGPGLRTAEQSAWLERLDAEIDNVRAAIAFSRSEPLDGGKDVDIAGDLWQYWTIRGHYTEGRSWMSCASGREGANPAARARALYGAALLADFQGDSGNASLLACEGRASADESGDDWLRGMSLVIDGWTARNRDASRSTVALLDASEIARSIADPWLLAEALSTLGVVELLHGADAPIGERFAEGLECALRSGDRWLIGELLFNLGMIDSINRDYDAMREHFSRSLEIRKELGDLPGIASSLHSLGNVAVSAGQFETAREHLGEALRIRRDLSNKTGIAASFEGFASLAAASDRMERAARLFGAAHQVTVAHHVVVFPIWLLDHDSYFSRARARLGDERFGREFDAGRRLTDDEAIAYALASDDIGKPPAIQEGTL